MSQTEAPDWVALAANLMLIEEATAQELPLTHLCNPKRKTRRIAAARWRIIARLRAEFVRVGGRIKRRENEHETPISTPMIGSLLDLDHSAVHHAINSEKRRRAAAMDKVHVEGGAP